MYIVRTWPAESAYTWMNDPHDRTGATCLLMLVPFCSLAKRAWPECTGLGPLPHLHFMQSQFPSSEDWKSGLVRFPSLADWSNKFVCIEGINGTPDWISEYPLCHPKTPQPFFFFWWDPVYTSFLNPLFFSDEITCTFPPPPPPPPFSSDEITCTLPSSFPSFFSDVITCPSSFPSFFWRDHMYMYLLHRSRFVWRNHIHSPICLTRLCSAYTLAPSFVWWNHARHVHFLPHYLDLFDDITLGMYTSFLIPLFCLTTSRSACTLPSSFPCFVWWHHARHVHFLPHSFVLFDDITLGMYTSFLIPLFCLTTSRSACTLRSSLPHFVWRDHACRLHFLPQSPPPSSSTPPPPFVLAHHAQPVPFLIPLFVQRDYAQCA